MARKIILIALGVVLLIVVIFLSRRIANPTIDVAPAVERQVQTVFVDTVYNKDIPIVVPATGTLVAKNRLELYSEVEGLFINSAHDFKPGQRYQRGQVLLQMDASEYAATVQSARSNLVNLITAIMPDLRLDYPDAFQKWQDYLNSFDIQKTTPPLPKADSPQEGYFITGRNIQTTYLNIKNLEERLSKFRITAPFTGVLTEALVTRGSLIRSGQKLGEFIDPSIYEMEVSVGKNFVDLLEVGKNVNLKNLQGTATYTGTVSRINASVDQQTQTVKVFLEVNGDNLREGMYLEANLDAREEENAYKLPRRLLIGESQIYGVRDSILDLIDVQVIYTTDRDVIVKGIPDGTVILRNVLPGAFTGQAVKVFEEQDSTTPPQTE